MCLRYASRLHSSVIAMLAKRRINLKTSGNLVCYQRPSSRPSLTGGTPLGLRRWDEMGVCCRRANHILLRLEGSLRPMGGMITPAVRRTMATSPQKIPRVVFPPEETGRFWKLLRGWAYIHFKEGIRPIRGVGGECKHPTLVMMTFIGLNVGIWAMWHDADTGRSQKRVDFMIRNFSMSHSGVADHWRVHTMLTNTISHIGLPHLLGNMFAFVLFGHKALKVLGTGPFVGLYIVGGFVASLASFLVAHRHINDPEYVEGMRQYVIRNWASASTNYENWLLFTYRGNEINRFREQLSPEEKVQAVTSTLLDRPCVGASGSVSAIAVACAMLFPRDRVIFFVRFPMMLKLPIPVAVGLFLVSDLIGVTQQFSQVAHEAHLGGMACGAAYVSWAWYVAHRYHTQHLGDLPMIKRLKRMLGK